MSDELTELLHATMPLCRTLGMRGVAMGAEEVVAELDWSAELCTGGGILHGGTLMAVADSVGAACAFANLPEGAGGTTTIESKTNFLGAATEGTTVRATARPLHAGRRTIVIETELRAGDRLVAKTTQTQAVL
ncbi:MAG: PaaI family thioesterase [Actinomycetota bacterium]